MAYTNFLLSTLVNLILKGYQINYNFTCNPSQSLVFFFHNFFRFPCFSLHDDCYRLTVRNEIVQLNWYLGLFGEAKIELNPFPNILINNVISSLPFYTRVNEGGFSQDIRYIFISHSHFHKCCYIVFSSGSSAHYYYWLLVVSWLQATLLYNTGLWSIVYCKVCAIQYLQ